MQNYQIPDSSLTASTSYSASAMGPANGRLHFQSKSGQYGAWAVSTNDQFQWFQVDFGNYAEITALATQGRQDGNWWVKTYSLSFSHDGVFFEDYQENNTKKVSTLKAATQSATFLSPPQTPFTTPLMCRGRGA